MIFADKIIVFNPVVSALICVQLYDIVRDYKRQEEYKRV